LVPDVAGELNAENPRFKTIFLLLGFDVNLYIEIALEALDELLLYIIFLGVDS